MYCGTPMSCEYMCMCMHINCGPCNIVQCETEILISFFSYFVLEHKFGLVRSPRHSRQGTGRTLCLLRLEMECPTDCY